MSPRKPGKLAISILGLLLGILICFFLAKVTDWGHGIRSPNAAWDYAAALVMATSIFALLIALPLPQEDRRPLAILWALRCLVTLGFMLLYENNYGLDAYVYYWDSKNFSYDMLQVGFGKGTGNIGYLVWHLNQWLPFQNSYHSLKVVFSLCGLFAVYFLYRSFVVYSGRSQPLLLLLVGAFPSVVFWSSILGKDPVMLLGICLYGSGILLWLGRENPIYLLIALAGAGIATMIRPWSGFILAVPTMALGFFFVRGAGRKIIYSLTSAAATGYGFQIFTEHFTFKSLDDLVHKTNIISKAWSIGGSRQDVPEFSSLGEMLAFAPQGMFTALFRPFPGEVRNLFGTLAGLENLAVLTLAYLALRRLSWSKLKEPAVAWALSLLVTWSFIYSYVSYQNLGSAVRFRLQVLPILLLVLYQLIRSARASGAEESPKLEYTSKVS